MSLFLWGGELDYGLSQEGSTHRVLDYPAILQLIEKKQAKMIIFIIQTKWWKSMFSYFPDPEEVVSTGEHGYTIVKY